MQKRLIAVLLILFSCSLFATEEGVVERFIKHGYGEKFRRASRAGIEASGEYKPWMKNPGVSFSFGRPFSGGDAYEMKLIGLSLSLDIAGNYFLEKDAAIFEGEAAQLSSYARLFSAVGDFRELLLITRLQEEKVTILADSQNRLDKMIGEVKGLVEGNSMAPLDLMRLRNASSVHRRRVVSETAALEGLKKRVETLIGGTFETVPFSIMLSENSSDDVVRKAMERNPILRKLERKLKAAEKRNDIAGRIWIPSPEVEGSIKRNAPDEGDPESSFEVGISFSLPIFDHGQKEKKVADAELKGLLFDYALMKRDLSATVGELYSRVVTLGNEDSAENDPMKTLDLVIESYRSGAAGINDVIETISLSEEVKISAVERKFERQQLILSLYRAAGYFGNEKIEKMVEGGVR